jgi:hypothetical protein
MHPRTIATLKRLEKAHWFSRVGVKDTQVARVLSSWDEAIEHCSSIDWENLCLEALNQFSGRLLAQSKERFSMWNEVTEYIRQPTLKLVDRKIEEVVRENRLPDVFRTRVARDILGLCMEAEYADVCPPTFFAAQSYWYAHGHFPCGWEGGFPPDGKLIIY